MSNLHAPRDGLRVLRTILVEVRRAHRLRRERASETFVAEPDSRALAAR